MVDIELSALDDKKGREKFVSLLSACKVGKSSLMLHNKPLNMMYFQYELYGDWIYARLASFLHVW